MNQPVLIAGQWRESHASGTFQAENPATREPLREKYPISTWADCDEALSAAAAAFEQMREMPAEAFARFLDTFAEQIEAGAAALVDRAHLETAYPKSPRLADVELPRTVNQLRQAATAAREGSWAMPTIDSKQNIRSQLSPIGPVCVFGPNNFPFAFNSIAGGDFAAAIATGCPVIAKANSSHPGTTELFAKIAKMTLDDCGLPSGAVQLIYRTNHADGERLVADSRLGATGYTGSRSAGLKLKAAADAAGKPIYLELSSTNPVVILPGALAERSAELVDQFCTSALMGAGQFCTNPGLVILIDGPASTALINAVKERFSATPGGTLLSKSVADLLQSSIGKLNRAGAEMLTGGKPGGGVGYHCSNTVLRVTGKQFLANPEVMQTEAFGNASLFVVADSVEQAAAILDVLEGNLTGCIYSDTRGADDSTYELVAAKLRPKVGRLLNDKMPTGVAVSPAMNHGGPYPSTGHPGFTAVGIPASLRRFGKLDCYDNVRDHRLPPALRNKNPQGKMWRSIDGTWTQADA